MDRPIAGFERDSGDRRKCQQHSVQIHEIESVFERPLAVLPDPDHSQAEQRFKAIGTTVGGRHVFVVFTLRDHGETRLIRPIGARFMHRKEIDHYEKTVTHIQDG